MILNKIPDKVKIGCFEYDVIITDEPIIIDGNCNYNGLINYNEQIIKLNKRMPENLMLEVFWHEVLHGIVHYFEFDLEDKKEEKMVELIARGLLMVVGDNVDKGTIENTKREQQKKKTTRQKTK